MRLSRLVSVGLAVFSLGTAVVLASALTKSLREYQQTSVAADAARAHTAWVDAQVALSLERDLTQIILQDERESSPKIKKRLRTQRALSDGLLFRSRNMASVATLEGTTKPFLEKSAELHAHLHQTRRNIDRFLGLDGVERSNSLNLALVEQFVRIVDQSVTVRENLRAFQGTFSSQAAALAAMLDRAEEAREYAGRARTPIAVALLQPARKRQPLAQQIDTNLLRATRAWQSVSVIATQTETSATVREAVAKAETLFHDSYGQTLQVFRFIWQASPGLLDGEEEAHFDRFFAESTLALDSINAVSDAVGQEIIRYWDDKSERALQSLVFYSVCVIALAAYMIAFYYFTKEMLVRRIENATAVITAVAEGDLEASADPRKSDLAEIAALHHALERFRDSLKKARDAERDARTDALTGLPNRRGLDDLLSGQSGKPLGADDVFGFLDLDDFKPINDVFGHETGDAVLREVALRLKSPPHGVPEVWRLGGDEFGMVWRDVPDEDLALWNAQHLLESLSEPISHKGKEIVVAASIGMARLESDAVNTQEIVSQADFAMFIAKHRPTNKFEFSNKRSSSRGFNITRRREILLALEKEEFEPFFQPQYSLATGRLEGFEVLARWRRSDGEVLTPGQFMSLVEHQKLQSRVDIFMLEKALKSIENWRGEYGFVPKVSVNMSEETLASEECRDHILSLFAGRSELVDHLVLEVTEDALVDRSANAIRKTLEAFAAAGVDLSMDDFGTGYGSFRHLKEYRFDEVKIDRSFVASMNDDRASYVMVEGFIAIAKGLNARVVAEGIETEEQRDRLMKLGCDIGQGYLLGRPGAVATADQILEGVHRQSMSYAI